MNCKECGFRLWALQSQALGVCAGFRDEAEEEPRELEERLADALADETKQEELL